MNCNTKIFSLGLAVFASLLPLTPALAQASAPASHAAAKAQPLTPPSGVFTTQVIGSRARPFFVAPPYAGLAVVGTSAVSNLAPNLGSFNAGSVDALDTPLLKQTFIVKNSSSSPLTIDRVAPTCSCTTAIIAPAKASHGKAQTSMPVKLDPGEEINVQVTVDLSDVPPGDLDKRVYISLAGSEQPVAVLEVVGAVKPSVTLSPALVDFGQVATGKTHTLQVTAQFDPRLATNGKLPLLVSSDPRVEVQEVPQITIVDRSRAASAPKGGRTWVREGKQSLEVTPGADTAVLTRTYEVTVPDKAPLGPLNATLSFAAAGQGPAKEQRLLQSATVLVVGQVTGDVSMQPQRIAFGTVPFGQATARQMLITELHAGALKDARVMSASPWLSASLVSADTQVNPFTTPVSSTNSQADTSSRYRVLRVILSPQTPAGNLESQIKVMLSTGEQVIIPVNAYIRGG